ncbi:DUF6624 domain-containing protein [Ferruginibacter yonginensis]|uniref:DUF6624 domain-containing protein n=1 Tax=Ferruginibacter yonginensis TaxID=1310416 RepID=A0ABV8QRG4_9BACT
MELIQSFKDPYFDKVNDTMKKWIPIFKSVFIDDQKNRILGYGFTKKGWKEQQKIDAQNLKIVTAFLDKYKWPTINDVGIFGQRTIGIVIQHAPLQIQEKYYPYLVDAYKKDPQLFETLALLEDRINVSNNRFQYYGTQLAYYKGEQVLYPVYNIDSLETWRKRIGFKISIENYFKLLRSNWNIQEYKSMLPDLINNFKVTNEMGIHYNF